VGNRLGGLPRVEPADLLSHPSLQESLRLHRFAVVWHAVAYAVNAVAGYYQAYGFANFGSSVLLGTFLAWLWWRLGLTSLDSAAQPLAALVLVIVSVVGILAETNPPFEKHVAKLDPVRQPSEGVLGRPLSRMLPGFEVPAPEPAPPPFVYHDYFVGSTTT